MKEEHLGDVDGRMRLGWRGIVSILEREIQRSWRAIDGCVTGGRCG